MKRIFIIGVIGFAAVAILLMGVLLGVLVTPVRAQIGQVLGQAVDRAQSVAANVAADTAALAQTPGDSSKLKKASWWEAFFRTARRIRPGWCAAISSWKSMDRR